MFPALISSRDQVYFSAASELHNAQMQALFTAYAASVKKPVEDDSGGSEISLFRLKIIEFSFRFCCPSNRTRAEDWDTESGYNQEQERRRQERGF